MNTLHSNSGTTTLIGIEQPETLRAPEIEKGVGCDFDNYLLVPDNTLDARIAALRVELETEEQESRQLIAQEQMKLKKFETDRAEMSRSRSVKKGEDAEGNGKQAKAQGGRK